MPEQAQLHAWESRHKEAHGEGLNHLQLQKISLKQLRAVPRLATPLCMKATQTLCGWQTYRGLLHTSCAQGLTGALVWAPHGLVHAMYAKGPSTEVMHKVWHIPFELFSTIAYRNVALLEPQMNNDRSLARPIRCHRAKDVFFTWALAAVHMQLTKKRTEAKHTSKGPEAATRRSGRIVEQANAVQVARNENLQRQ
eukprot:1149208-Pelagomonas_calceolata.AAC.4